MSSSSGCRSIGRRICQKANLLGQRHQFRQALGPRFLHHHVAMGFYGTFGTAQRAGHLLVGATADDVFEDFPLTRRQCRDMSANDVQPALQGSRHFMMRNRPLDCLKKNIR